LLIEECKKLLREQQWQPNSVLDLGCGYGYLTLMSGDLNIPLKVATDNNCAAIKAAIENFRHAGLDVHCTLDDCGSNIKQQFELILCNPPFHRGFKTSGAITQKFLRNTQRLLDAKGTALWVLNAFIDVEQGAIGHFQNLDVLAENNLFKVLAMTKPFN
jgi:16S rRNA (guanine1207-N2)-methyltransferase